MAEEGGGNGGLYDIAQRFAMLQAGLDHIDQGITVFDGELRLVAWNRRFFHLLDFPEDGLAEVGTPFAAFMRYNAERGEYGPGDVAGQVSARVDAARRFQAHTLERTRPHTGQVIAVRGEPLPGEGFVTVYTDITAQRYQELMLHERSNELDRRVRQRTTELEEANASLRAAEAEREATAVALRRSEERLRLITDSVPAFIAYIDNRRIYRFANRGYAAWFGYGKDEIIGLSINTVLGPAVLAEIGGYIEAGLAGQTVSYTYMNPAVGSRRGADGLPDPVGSAQPGWARSTLVPERDEGGRIIGLFVLSIDITEQKMAEAALLQAQKMEAVGQLTGGLAHDFNNLLTIVVGNLIALEEAGGLTPEHHALLASALAAARRGVDQGRRLLAFARRQPLTPEWVDVAERIHEAMPLLVRSAPAGIDIAVSIDARPLAAVLDAVHLDGALLNLVLNARDAMPEGGRITVRATKVELPSGAVGEAALPGLSMLPPGRYVRISVTDSGRGMDADTAVRAFEPFFTTKAFGSGSGLGLAMVYAFAQQSGGLATIDSTPGAGTTVTLWLPEAKQTELPAVAMAQDRGADSATAPGSLPLVLLVEDDREVRQIVRRQLTELGYSVIEAAGAADALDLLAGVPAISLMLSDVVMPGDMSGVDLSRRARALRPALCMALMSGHPAGVAADDLAGVPLLVKPFGRAELAAALLEARRS